MVGGLSMTMPKIEAIKLLHKMSVNTIQGGKHWHLFPSLDHSTMTGVLEDGDLRL